MAPSMRGNINEKNIYQESILEFLEKKRPEFSNPLQPREPDFQILGLLIGAQSRFLRLSLQREYYEYRSPGVPLKG